MVWLGVAYLGSLAVLFVTAFWTQNGFTGEIVQVVTLDNFRTLFTDRRLPDDRAADASGSPLLVTVIDALIALPMALYMAKVAGRGCAGSCWSRVLTPLWASYLVKAYAWRGMLAEGGLV